MGIKGWKKTLYIKFIPINLRFYFKLYYSNWNSSHLKFFLHIFDLKCCPHPWMPMVTLSNTQLSESTVNTPFLSFEASTVNSRNPPTSYLRGFLCKYSRRYLVRGGRYKMHGNWQWTLEGPFTKKSNFHSRVLEYVIYRSNVKWRHI